MKNLIRIIVVFSAVVVLSACVTQQPSIKPAYNPYTSGNVTLTLRKGSTTQNDVLKAFGAPNIVTQTSDGGQVWIYQKDNLVTQSSGSSSYITLLLVGSGSDVNSYQQSSRTMTITIQFDKQGVVSDYSSMSTSF